MAGGFGLFFCEFYGVGDEVEDDLMVVSDVKFIVYCTRQGLAMSGPGGCRAELPEFVSYSTRTEVWEYPRENVVGISLRLASFDCI